MLIISSIQGNVNSNIYYFLLISLAITVILSDIDSKIVPLVDENLNWSSPLRKVIHIKIKNV